MGSALSLATAAQGGRVAWVVPSYRNGRPLWRAAENAVAPLKQAHQVQVNRADRTIEFRNGGGLGIYSADSPDSLRGEAFHLVIEDEAARIPPDVHTDVILPTLADYDGEAILISTPKGRNWFWVEYKRGVDDGRYQAAFTAPSSANPSARIRRAFELARERVSERTFRQEWLAEFVEDGSYFYNIDQVATVKTPESPADHKEHTFVMGVDWAKSYDFTVLTVICRQCSRVVDWERFNKIDYTFQRARLKALFDKWKVSKILPERNSIGEPNIEMLVRENLPIINGADGRRGFNMTASTKAALMESLALALGQGKLTVPVIYGDELRAFEIETRPIGPARYGAPEGLHDDMVISLALAWQAAQTGLQIW